MAAASIIVELLAKTGSFVTDTKRAEDQLKSLNRQMKGSKLASDEAYDSFKKTGASLKSLASIGIASYGITGVIDIADAYKKFTSQLKIATSSQAEFASAYASVVRISRDSQSDIESIGNLYARLSRSTKDAGVSQKEIATVTETVALALRVGNATAKETSSVMLQLSQSFAAGRLNGQEFAAVAENGPILFEKLAKSMGKTIGELKKLGAEGLITREQLLKAFGDQQFLDSLREQVKEVRTVGSAMQVFRNELNLFIGEADTASGASKAFAGVILSLAQNLDVLANIAFAGLTVAVGRYIASKYASIAATLASTAAENASLVSKQRLANANLIIANSEVTRLAATSASSLAMANNAALTTTASAALARQATAQAALTASMAAGTAGVGLLSKGMALLGGPIGIAIIGFTALAYWINKLANDSNEKLYPALGKINERLEKNARLAKAGISTGFGDNEFSGQILSIKELQINYENLQKKVDSTKKKIKDASALKDFGFGGGAAGLDLITEKINLDLLEKQLKSAKTLIEEEEKSLEKSVKSYNEGLNKIGVTDTSSFDALNSKLKTARNITDDYNKSVKEYLAEGFKVGASQEIMREGLVELEKQYKRDISALDKKEKTTKVAKDANEEFIKSLIKQNVTIGLGEIELIKYEQSLLKLTPAQKALSDSLIGSIESQKKNNESIKEATSLNEKYLDPIVKLNTELVKLQELASNGLSFDAMAGGVKELINAYNDATKQAYAFDDVLKELSKSVSESANTDGKEKLLNLVVAYKDLEEQLKSGAIGIEEFTQKSQELLKITTEQSVAVDKLNATIANTPTAQLEEQRKAVKAIYDEYATGKNTALDSFEELTEIINVQLGRQVDSVKEASDAMEEFAKQAARNMQDAFADFLFDPFKDGMSGMLLGFVNTLKKMASEALAAEIFKKLGTLGGGSSGGGFLSAIGSFFGGAKASGGDVISGRSYLVGESGPEMFTPRTTGSITPNSDMGGGASNLSIKNINVLDPSLLGQYLNTDEGERLIVNVIQKNRNVIS